MNLLQSMLTKICVLLGMTTISIHSLAQPAPLAAGAKTEVLWLGQAGFRIKSPGGQTIVIDPWLTGGPKTPAPYKTDISALGKVDLLLVTHAHVDHIGDAPALAKLHKTVLYGPADMITPLVTLGVMPAELTHRFNKTGSVKPLPGIKVTAVQAEHSSLLVWKNPATEKLESHPAGEAVGYIIEMENGFKIWHMGDTGMFGDMKLIGDVSRVDVMMACIGDKFTMGPERAAAAVELVNPRMVIPMHFGTYPVLHGKPADLAVELKARKVKTPMREMTVGETLTL